LKREQELREQEAKTRFENRQLELANADVDKRLKEDEKYFEAEMHKIE